MIPNRKEFLVLIRHSLPAALAIGTLALFGLARNVGAADPVIVQGGCGPTGPAVCCDDGCHKVCQPTVETRDVAKRCYGSRCEDFCLPKCSSLLGKCFGFSGCSGCCGGGACHDCEKPRTRKYLILYVRHHEESVPKCVVVDQRPTACVPCPTVGAPCPPQCATPYPPSAVPHMATPPMPSQGQIYYQNLPAGSMTK